MNTRIQDVYSLGWKLEAVVKGQASDSSLDTYAEERSPIADWLLKATSECQRTMMTAATTGKGAMEKLATNDGTQLNLDYRNSSFNNKKRAYAKRRTFDLDTPKPIIARQTEFLQSLYS